MKDFLEEAEKNGGVIVVRGGLRVLRRATEIAEADGRDFAELTPEAQSQYVELAKQERR